MKKFVIAILLLSVISCKEKIEKSAETIESANIVDQVDSKSSSFRYSKGENLVEQIYQEQIKDNQPLKDLDDKIQSLKEQNFNLSKEQEKILLKSENYYRDAHNLTAAIKDSTIKKETILLVENSKKLNDEKEKPYRDLLKLISDNEFRISDFYTALKIKKTIPEIEKFQKENPLKLDSLHNLVKKQEVLLQQLKNLK